MKHLRGAAMVEFAIVALVFFLILFGIVEFARLFFTWNTLVEATRRGARVASVCPVSPSGRNQVRLVTVFDNTPTDGTQGSLLGLTMNDVNVKYYIEGGVTGITEIAESDLPADGDVTNPIYDNIAFVGVEIIPSNYHLLIPGFSQIIQLPKLQTILPRESLGRISPSNPVTQRRCY